MEGSISGRSSPAAWWVVAPILGLSACLNLANLGFPFAFHADEPIKVDFIQRSTQNFNHPLLMLQLVRGANVIMGLTDAQAIAVLGRALVGLCASITVLLSYLLARRSMSVRHSAVVATAVAVAPTLVVHAHYLKEDTILTTCLMASILCYFVFAERPSARSALSLGVVTGMAFSAHYKAILRPAVSLPGSARRFRACSTLAAPSRGRRGSHRLSRDQLAARP
ncbi:MAG: phospholipid carrier-dependent glycosyltransferase [Acidobacteria bacterium]|nr:phospholipid carrier-dependent glycosyltransferase [Acidobacteriota bacterium]